MCDLAQRGQNDVCVPTEREGTRHGRDETTYNDGSSKDESGPTRKQREKVRRQTKTGHIKQAEAAGDTETHEKRKSK